MGVVFGVAGDFCDFGGFGGGFGRSCCVMGGLDLEFWGCDGILGLIGVERCDRMLF